MAQSGAKASWWAPAQRRERFHSMLSRVWGMERKRESMNLLVSLDENYLPQLQVLLASLCQNCPGETGSVYLLHRSIPRQKLDGLGESLKMHGWELCPIPVGESLFSKAPVTKQYPQEMYYRLLAGHLLPREVNRVLYLDPDILVINPLKPLWQMDLQGNLFAAAAHTGKTELANSLNRVRLGTERDYYNSGVLLMDLERCREEIRPQELFSFVEEHSRELVLPDQDVLNALYGDRVLPLDDVIWNYDARNYSSYLMRSMGEADLPWVMRHTAILHFCGKEKPWKPYYRHRFGVLYLHYEEVAKRWFSGQGAL